MEKSTDQKLFKEFFDHIKANGISWDNTYDNNRLYVNLTGVFGPEMELMQCQINDGVWKFFVGSKKVKYIPHNELKSHGLM